MRTKTKRGQIGTLAYRLRATRRKKGWTQEQLGTQAGTTQAVIQKIENGKSLRPRRIDEIAQALGVNPAWLIFGNEAFSGLSDEAIEVAKAWSKIREPHRSNLKEMIFEKIAGTRSG